MSLRLLPVTGRPGARALLAGAVLLLVCALPGCGGGCGREEAPTPPEALHWPPLEGATGYTVRAWSGHRLLFEESSLDTLLPLDPNLQRTLAAFDTVSVEVRGEGAGPSAVRRWRLWPAEEPGS